MHRKQSPPTSHGASWSALSLRVRFGENPKVLFSPKMYCFSPQRYYLCEPGPVKTQKACSVPALYVGMRGLRSIDYSMAENERKKSSLLPAYRCLFFSEKRWQEARATRVDRVDPPPSPRPRRQANKPVPPAAIILRVDADCYRVLPRPWFVRGRPGGGVPVRRLPTRDTRGPPKLHHVRRNFFFFRCCVCLSVRDI